MKLAGKLLALSLVAASATPAWAVGDPAAGQVKGIACFVIKGDDPEPAK
jgi:hypothetical protein